MFLIKVCDGTREALMKQIFRYAAPTLLHIYPNKAFVASSAETPQHGSIYNDFDGFEIDCVEMNMPMFIFFIQPWVSPTSPLSPIPHLHPSHFAANLPIE